MSINGRTAAQTPDQQLLQKRRDFSEAMALMPVEPRVRVSTVQLGSVPAVELTPDPRPAKVLLYFHGGGYRMGNARSFAGFCSHLAVQLSSRVLTVDYRVAPENPFPAALDDALAAYMSVANTHDGPILVGGDSAGGGLVAALLLQIPRHGLRGPIGAFLLCPWADLRVSADSYRECEHSDLLWSATSARQAAQMYLAGHDPSDPAVSPVLGDWTGQPALLVQASRAEVLRDDARLLAAVAANAGVDVEHHEFEGAPHVWQYGYATSESARTAITQIRDFVDRISLDIAPSH